MNIENMNKLADTLDSGIESEGYLFYMNVERCTIENVKKYIEDYKDGKHEDLKIPENCGTACCMKGLIELYLNPIVLEGGLKVPNDYDSAMNWLGITQAQAVSLFFACGPDTEVIYEGIEEPLELVGAEGSKIAAQCVRKAIELWS